jgi:hypothetical protein
MAWLELLELFDLVRSWRFYGGIAATILLVWSVFQFIPNQSVAWVICIPLGITGSFLSLTWQSDAETGR